MYQITVTKKGFVKAVYFNKDSEIGLFIARAMHGSKCEYSVEYQ